MSDIQKEKILKYFSLQTIRSTPNKIPESNKPLWVNSVKEICKEIIPKIDIKEVIKIINVQLEYAKNELIKQNESELDFLQGENNPYLNTMKKLMYAFGDMYKNDTKSVIYLNNFLKKWYKINKNRFIILIKILLDCEFKKIIEHLFSHEYSKYFTYKKLKFKNNFTVIIVIIFSQNRIFQKKKNQIIFPLKQKKRKVQRKRFYMKIVLKKKAKIRFKIFSKRKMKLIMKIQLFKMLGLQGCQKVNISSILAVERLVFFQEDENYSIISSQVI